jgi:hypothetical protein
VGRIVALPTHTQATDASVQPHELSVPSARTIEMSPTRSSFAVVAVVQSDRRAAATVRPPRPQRGVGQFGAAWSPRVRSVCASARVIAI